MKNEKSKKVKRNTEYAFATLPGSSISPASPTYPGSSTFASSPVVPTRAASLGTPVSLRDMERAHIEEVLRQTGGMIGGKGGAAEILGLPASTLRSRIKKLGLK